MTKLSSAFYQRETLIVAKSLLGKRLVHRINAKQLVSGIIIETEAYTGIEDPACHTYGNKKTKRNAAMYLAGGHVYVYLIYGMYNCLNVVTRSPRYPEAVLIRALQPDQGLKTMMKLRKTEVLRNLASGPGKLCQAMSIDRALDGQSLVGQKIYIEHALRPSPASIVSRARVGVDYAGQAASWPYRFYLKDNDFISKP